MGGRIRFTGSTQGTRAAPEREAKLAKGAESIALGSPHASMIAAVRLAVLALAAAAACGDRLGISPEERTSAERRGATIIVGRPSDASSLDPARPTDNESAEVVSQIYETLVRYRADSTDVEPALATRWEVDATGTVWTFTLREGVTFHDGTPFDAAAVVFSFERQRDPTHPFHTGRFGYWENQYKNIARVEAVDPRTVRITIADRYAPFLASMAMFPVAIVSPAAVERWGAEFPEHPVGTGPFRFERWERGDRIVLVRNPRYWDVPALAERVVFETIPDARQRLVDLESGAIDLALAVLPEELQFVDLHPGLTLYRKAANNVTYLAFNCLHPPFDDPEVRRALTLAINKQPIVRMAYQGLAIPADGALPPGQWGHLEIPSRYDPDEARQRLAELAAAGRVDLGKRYRLFAPTTPRPYLPNPEQVARVLRSNLEAVGLRVDLVLQPFSAQRADTEAGNHDLALAGWGADNGDPDNYLYLLFHEDNTTPGIARNLSFYRNREVSRLLIAAQRVEDRAARDAIYADVQRRIADDAPWVPLAHSEVAIAARDDISGIQVQSNGSVIYAGLHRVVR